MVALPLLQNVLRQCYLTAFKTAYEPIVLGCFLHVINLNTYLTSTILYHNNECTRVCMTDKDILSSQLKLFEFTVAFYNLLLLKGIFQGTFAICEWIDSLIGLHRELLLT